MVLPLILRPGRRLVIHTRLSSRIPTSALKPVIIPGRWNSTVAQESTPTDDVAVEDIKRLPEEAQALLARRYPLIHEFIGPSQSHLLTLTLQPYLNFSDIAKSDPQDTDAPHNPFTIKNMLPFYGQTLPPGFHFAYFNGYTPESELSSDGYIAAQSPGGPWTRRMWAGGKLTYQPMPEKRDKGNDRGARRARSLNVGRRAYCHETIEDIQMKGEPGSPNEMMFVYLRRKMWAEGYIIREPTKSPKMKDYDPEEEETKVLPDDEVPLIEQRCLVYMREKPEENKSKADGSTTKAGGNGSGEIAPTSKISSRAEKADFKHTVTPTTSLLFRYSALTFNAHKIHIDSDYTKNTEGHKDLIVHGPLTLTFLLELLRNHSLGLEKQYKLNTFEYRNIAPTYVNENLHLYGRQIENAPLPPVEDEYDPRMQLVPMYDEMDNIRKELRTLGFDQEIDMTPEEKKAKKKELRRTLSTLKKASEKLEKFNLIPKRDIEYRTYELWAENDKGQVVVRGTAVLEDIPAKVELSPEQQWKRYQSEMARNKKMMQKQQLLEHKARIRAKRRERKQRLRNEQMAREKLRREMKDRILKETKEAIARGELPVGYQPDFSSISHKMAEMAKQQREEREREYALEDAQMSQEDMRSADWNVTLDENYEEEPLDERYEQEDEDGDEEYDDEYDEDGNNEFDEKLEEEYDDDDVKRR